MMEQPKHPRIAPVATASPEVAAILAKTIIDSRGIPLNIFATLAHHPRLLGRFNALGGLFLTKGELPGRERELVVLRTAWHTRSEYEWGQHVRIGIQVGLTEDEIARVAEGAVDRWSTDDANLLRFTDELLETADVSDAVWQPQRDRWSDAQLLELVLLPGFYRMVAGFLKAIRVAREVDLPRLPSQ